MRIWDIDPGFLNDNSLLGEHRELHGIAAIHGQKKKGYSRHPETLRWGTSLSGLCLRHALLVSEMTLRGFTHQSPLDGLSWAPETAAWPEDFIDLPHAQFSLLQAKYAQKPLGRIPLPRTTDQLWACHKYSVMARDPNLYRHIGPRVAENAVSFEDLSLTLVRLLRKPPAPGRLINALDHMWGYVSAQSDRSRTGLGPGALLQEIQTLALAQGQGYLCHSTALGELGVWLGSG